MTPRMFGLLRLVFDGFDIDSSRLPVTEQEALASLVSEGFVRYEDHDGRSLLVETEKGRAFAEARRFQPFADVKL